jgi:hypothetical protein
LFGSTSLLQLVWFNVAPASIPDGFIGELPGGLFEKLLPGERVLTDGASTYVGSVHCFAPPARSHNAFVEDYDKAELTLQRGVERINHLLRAWKVLGKDTIFRMAPSEPGFWTKISSVVAVVCKMTALDIQYSDGY